MELIRKLGTKLNKTGHLQSWAIFWCDECNREVERILNNGLLAVSCGCIPNNYIHGESDTKLYHVWHGMKQRVLYSKHKFYKYYGGRGIKICPEWIESYMVFRDWSLANGYKENLQINRIENDGNYEPNNCNWVTPKENSNNRRSKHVN